MYLNFRQHAGFKEGESLREFLNSNGAEHLKSKKYSQGGNQKGLHLNDEGLGFGWLSSWEDLKKYTRRVSQSLGEDRGEIVNDTLGDLSGIPLTDELLELLVLWQRLDSEKQIVVLDFIRSFIFKPEVDH